MPTGLRKYGTNRGGGFRKPGNFDRTTDGQRRGLLEVGVVADQLQSFLLAFPPLI